MKKTGKILPVQISGSPVLAQTAAPVSAITPEIRSLAMDMIRSMDHFDGIGLAAPQIGVSLRLVVMAVPFPESGAVLSQGEEMLLPHMPLVLINPQIIAKSDKLTSCDEGCLSVPGIYAPVIRPEKVVLQTQLLDGSMITCECGGLLGRCVQHELDHLDGMLFTDRLAPDAAQKIGSELDLLKKSAQKHNFLREVKG